jgi:hypothetical protein
LDDLNKLVNYANRLIKLIDVRCAYTI